MGDYVIKSGDTLQLTFPPNLSLTTPVPPPWSLSGTSPNVKIMKAAACLVGDELPPPLRAPMLYTSPPFNIPGSGTLQLILLPTNIAKLAKNNHKPLLLKGAVFQALFNVQTPATQVTPAGVTLLDPLMVKPGTAQFNTTNVVVRAS